MTVTPVNDAPVAEDDHATTTEETPVAIDILANDGDIDSVLDPSSVTVTTPPAHGTTSVDPATGQVTYTPEPNWSGTDTFTYQVCDGATPALCDSAVVTVDVTPTADPPAAADDAGTTPEDTPITIDILGNDSDPDGNLDPTSVSITAGPLYGTVAIDPATGEVTYTPDPDWNGNDAFSYQVCDSGSPAACVTASVLVTVTPVNDPPAPVDDAAITGENEPVTIDVIGNDTDPDNDLDPNSFVIVVDPAHGTVTYDPTTGELVYTPDQGFTGTDTFTYRVCDTTGNCRTATVSVAVGAPSTFTFVAPGSRIVQVPGLAILMIGAFLGLFVAFLFDRRRRRREWDRMLRRAAIR